MLCSEKELDLSEEGAGIWLLDPSLPLGVPLEKALDLKDWILEVNITPNRADCLCVIGLAREISALSGSPLRYPPEGAFAGPAKGRGSDFGRDRAAGSLPAICGPVDSGGGN